MTDATCFIRRWGKNIAIFTPYRTAFICKIKTIEGATWDSADRAWLAPSTSLDTVIEMIRKAYKTEPVIEKTHTVRLTFTRDYTYKYYYTEEGDYNAAMFGPYKLAYIDRKRGFHISASCELEDGKIANDSKYNITIFGGTIFILHGVTEPQLIKMHRSKQTLVQIEEITA